MDSRTLCSSSVSQLVDTHLEMLFCIQGERLSTWRGTILTQL